MRLIKKGATDVQVHIKIMDSSDGTPETGVVWNTSGIDLWYRRQGAAKVSITEATLSALTDAHADGGFLHVGDGVYRLDLPDAAVASGVEHVVVGGTVTGMIVVGEEIQLVAYDPQDTVRAGLTALPNAAAEAAGGLYTRGSGAGQINQPANGQVDVLVADKTGFALSTAGVQAIWDALTSALTTVGSIGKRIVDYLTGDAFARLGAPAGASVSADVAAIKSDTGAIKTKTDNLPADPSSEGSLPVVGADGKVILSSDAHTGATIPTVTTVTNVTNAVKVQGQYKKNTAVSNYTFKLVDITDGRTAETGLAGITGKVSKDGAAFGNLTNAGSIAEISDGWYKLDLDAADVNADEVILQFYKAGTSRTFEHKIRTITV